LETRVLKGHWVLLATRGYAAHRVRLETRVLKALRVLQEKKD
jgi:hypothetical protein